MKKIASMALVLLLYTASPRALAAGPGDRLVPVGQAVGIQMNCQGVIVSELAEVQTENGSLCPAAEAGLRPGDRIVYFNGEPVRSGPDFLRLAGEMDGGEVRLRAVRAGEERLFTLTPVRSARGDWQLGLWLRDGVHGIGTVTWWDPVSGRFGALGHGVSLPGSDDLLAAAGGVITRASVTSAIPGSRGVPGELVGVPDRDDVLGVLEDNTPQGVFGAAPDLNVREAVPVAADGQIRLGPATILATVDGRGPREFAAEIIRVVRSGAPTRQLTLSVTDPALLEVTGGIVQGMSGSPILQDGRLVGAVTHVLVSDPSTGYGITMENMLAAAQSAPSAAA